MAAMKTSEIGVLQERVEERLKALGKKPAPLAKSLGYGDSFIRDILRKGVMPGGDRLRRLAEALETTTEYLLGRTDALGPSTLGTPITLPSTPPIYAGKVQAGSWLAVDEYFQQDAYPVPEFVTRHPAYPRLRQYAWQAQGDSMNERGIIDGMWVVGADASDYIDQIGEVESGDLVVVERTRHQGAERELTIKEARFYRDRMELLPRSTNASHQPIVVPHNRKAEDHIEVKIIGVVLTAYTDLRRRP